MLNVLIASMLLIPAFSSLVIVLLGVLVIFGATQNSFTFKLDKITGLFFLFFLIYVVGFIFSGNQEIGGKYIEYKLSMFAFPLIFSFRPKAETQLRPLFLTFLGSLFVLSIFGFIHGVGQFLETGALQSFFASNISYIHHPTYLGLYLLVALEMLHYGYKRNWSLFQLKLVLPLSLFFILMLFASGSLAGLLFFCLMVLVKGIQFIFRKYGRKVGFLSVVLLPILFYVGVNYTPVIDEQFEAATIHFKDYVKGPEEFVKTHQTYVGGNELRLILWTVTSKAIAQHPMGVGTGNHNKFINENLEALNQKQFVARNYDPHNQFLMTTLELGIIGGLFFLFLLVMLLKQSWSLQNSVFTILVLAFAFNCLFESMLQRQSGIVFFVFWSCLFLAQGIKKSKDNA